MKKYSQKPVIGIIMGDAAGIGPEIIIKALEKQELISLCSPLIIGSKKIMEQAAGTMHKEITFTALDYPGELTTEMTAVPVLDCEIEENMNFRWGVADSINGRNTVACLKKGVELAMKKEIDGMVIAPLNKEAMHKGGLDFPDEITFMAHLAETKVSTVIKWDKIFRSTVVGHVPFRQIPKMLTKERIIPVIKNLSDTIKRLMIKSPHIGVAALNPHGGEDGRFGDEEIREIGPAVKAAQKAGIQVSGPFPADTIFIRAMKGQFDGIVFLYHDQGNIAMKSAAFGNGVLIYTGLSFPCTSVAHGTAYGKAGKGTADPINLEEAIKMTVEMISDRIS